MKILPAACFVSIILLFSVGGVEAGQEGSEGAGQRGLSLSIGYDGSYFSYKETMDGGVLDQDTGWMNGLFLEAQYDKKEMFIRGSIDVNGSNSATYKGELLNGTPLTMKTSEFFYQSEASVGYKVLNFSNATLSPYFAIGFRYWDRGENNLPNYLETYTWGYAALGGNFVYRYGKGLIGLDASIQFTIDPTMQTDTGGIYDTATFNLKPEPGFHIEVPMTYEVNQGMLSKMSFFARPYYQRWNIGASDPVLLTQNGFPANNPLTGQPPFYVFEPDSHTDIYGVKFGVSVNY
jgi:hypothetical protein